MPLLIGWGILLGVLFLGGSGSPGSAPCAACLVDLSIAIGTLARCCRAGPSATWRCARRAERLHGDSQWSIAARHFRKNRLAMAGLVVMLLLYLITLVTR